MIDVYHKTMGWNCILELDLFPDRSGAIPKEHAARYKQLGDFISSYHSKPILSDATHSSNEKSEFTIRLGKPTSIDRVLWMEDQINGQVIRSYQVHTQIVDSQDADSATDIPFKLVSNRTSMGHKKIDIFDKAISVTEVLVNTTYVDTLKWRSVSLYLCD